MYKHREEKKTREIVKFVILFYRIIFLKYCCVYIFRCIILRDKYEVNLIELTAKRPTAYATKLMHAIFTKEELKSYYIKLPASPTRWSKRKPFASDDKRIEMIMSMIFFIYF